MEHGKNLFNNDSEITVLETAAIRAREEFDLVSLIDIKDRVQAALAELEPGTPAHESYSSMLTLCNGFVQVVEAKQAVYGEIGIGDVHGAE
jgi:hypothetical protein